MSLRALQPTEVVTQLSQLKGWQLRGDGAAVGIEKTFAFDHYHAVMAFVNALAFMAQDMNHHPTLTVQFGACVVHYTTHDVGGLSALDFASAQRAQAWFDQMSA